MKTIKKWSLLKLTVTLVNTFGAYISGWIFGLCLVLIPTYFVSKKVDLELGITIPILISSVSGFIFSILFAFIVFRFLRKKLLTNAWKPTDFPSISLSLLSLILLLTTLLLTRETALSQNSITKAIRSQDPTHCEQAQNKEFCYQRLIDKSNNPEPCTTMPDSEHLSLCYFRLALKLEDVKLCGKIEVEYHLNCFTRFINSPDDIQLCLKLPNQDLIDKCYMEAAPKLKDKSICDFIKNSVFRTTCIERVNKVKKQSSIPKSLLLQRA